MLVELWPALPYDEWKDTYATLHMWTQIVGKIALAQAPPINHCWAVALHVTSRGLRRRRCRTVTARSRYRSTSSIIDSSSTHVGRQQRTLALAPRSVADFYREVTATLSEHVACP